MKLLMNQECVQKKTGHCKFLTKKVLQLLYSKWIYISLYLLANFSSILSHINFSMINNRLAPTFLVHISTKIVLIPNFLMLMTVCCSFLWTIRKCVQATRLLTQEYTLSIVKVTAVGHICLSGCPNEKIYTT